MKEKDDGLCRAVVVHEETVQKVKREMSTEDTYYDMAEFFHVFDDATRLKIIDALLVSEMCVCDLSAAIGMSQSAISHHLKVLRQARVIRLRRQGKMAYYSLCDGHIRSIFQQGQTHVEE
ncbi:MAG TPA: transcriptional regulator [Ruminococcaceae bacterium]|nr:transcriptional regulator [Oscillospiraceae bacterium]